MPQLDTIFILTVFLWTWLMMYLMMKKMTTVTMTRPQTHEINKPLQPAPLWL